MPTISFFYGIAIRMYLKDHSPPLYAVYGEYEACFFIETGGLQEGRLPKTADRLVREWSTLNREALLENWNLARQGLLPKPIGGLDVEQDR
jgi:hypothetical protein